MNLFRLPNKKLNFFFKEKTKNEVLTFYDLLQSIEDAKINGLKGISFLESKYSLTKVERLELIRLGYHIKYQFPEEVGSMTQTSFPNEILYYIEWD